MTKTTQRAAADKWDAAHMAYQTIKVRRELLDSFKAACAARGDRVNTVLREAIEKYVALYPKKERRYPRTEEQREKYKEYQRRYRSEHKDKTRQWQNNYIIRKAARLQEAKENEHE